MPDEIIDVPVVDTPNVLPSSSLFGNVGGSTTISGKGGGSGGFNSKIIIEKSTEWRSPVTGFVKMTLIGGGAGGQATVRCGAATDAAGLRLSGAGGNSGVFKEIYVYVKQNEKYTVVVGKGGKGQLKTANNITNVNYGEDGGDTTIIIWL